MESFCVEGMPQIVGGIVAGIVTVASVVANIVKSDTVLGKIVHFLALNIKKK